MSQLKKVNTISSVVTIKERGNGKKKKRKEKLITCGCGSNVAFGMWSYNGGSLDLESMNVEVRMATAAIL